MPKIQFIETKDGGSVIPQRCSDGSVIVSRYDALGSRVDQYDLDDENLKTFIRRLNKVRRQTPEDVKDLYTRVDNTTTPTTPNINEVKSS
jgi:hypothetical protein